MALRAEGTCPVCVHAGLQRHPLNEGARIWLGYSAFDCSRCGVFMIADSSRLHEHPDRWRVECEVRARAIAGGPPLFLHERDDLLPNELPMRFVLLPVDDYLTRRLGIRDRMDRTLINFARLSKRLGGTFSEHDIPWTPAVMWSPHDVEAGWIHRALEVEGLSAGDLKHRHLTLKGWLRFEELSVGTVPIGARPQVFVAMWFDSSLDRAFSEGVRPAVEACGYDAQRIDLVDHNDLIEDRIFAGIRAAPFVVADLTGQRPSVYLEAGFAMGLGLPVIHSVRADHLNSVAFDAAHRSIVCWKDEADLRNRLEQRIRATIAQPRVGSRELSAS